MRLVYDLRIVEPKMHGMARYALELLQAMLEQEPGLRVDALLSGPQAQEHLPGDDRIRPHFCALAPYSPQAQFKLPGLLKSLAPDIYHCPFFGPPVGYAGPMLITLHDLIHLKFPKDYGLKQRLYYRLVVGPAARKADRVFTVSQHSKKDLVRLLGVDPQKVVVTYNGVGAGFRPQEAGALESQRRTLGLPGAYILGVGNPKPHKNLAGLVKAHEILQETAGADAVPPLVLAGAGPGQIPAGPGVRFLDHLNDKGLVTAYAAARMVVVPSFYEGFGLPALEAMACGAPLIVSNRASLPEVAEGAGLLCEPDPPALARAMELLLRDEELAQRLREQGPKRAAKFTWQRVAADTLQTYRQVLAERAAS